MGEILRFPQRQLFAIAKRGELARVPAGDDRFLPFADLIANAGDFRPATVGLDDVAVLQYTGGTTGLRSEEHTSELQSLMRISYAVFCLKKKNQQNNKESNIIKNN